MSKERLEELKKRTTGKDYLWAIEYAKEQIERIQELERQLKVSYSIHAEDRKLLNRRSKQNKRYCKARKRIEARYDKEYDIQSNEYEGGITDGLMIAMGIIDRTLEDDEE